MKSYKCLSAVCGLLALSQSQLALAQEAAKPCVRQADFADAVVYAMPAVIGAIQTKCASSLSANGFLKAQGAKLRSTYTAQQTPAWPGARRFLMQFTSSGRTDVDGEMGAMIASLPSEAVRPFVDALVQQEVAKKIPLTECRTIEQGISLLAPLPPKNVGGLAGFLFKVSGVKDPAICETT